MSILSALSSSSLLHHLICHAAILKVEDSYFVALFTSSFLHCYHGTTKVTDELVQIILGQVWNLEFQRPFLSLLVTIPEYILSAVGDWMRPYWVLLIPVPPTVSHHQWHPRKHCFQEKSEEEAQ
ncbi:hypothetical protein JHK82_053537 [Glycine max]|nr:hypothetical protein JHK82_053537 [Glycine max]